MRVVARIVDGRDRQIHDAVRDPDGVRVPARVEVEPREDGGLVGRHEVRLPRRRTRVARRRGARDLVAAAVPVRQVDPAAAGAARVVDPQIPGLAHVGQLRDRLEDRCAGRGDRHDVHRERWDVIREERLDGLAGDGDERGVSPGKPLAVDRGAGVRDRELARRREGVAMIDRRRERLVCDDLLIGEEQISVDQVHFVLGVPTPFGEAVRTAALRAGPVVEQAERIAAVK